MVDLTLQHRTKHFVPLALFRQIADDPSPIPPEEVSYIGTDGVKAIKGLSAYFKSSQSRNDTAAGMALVGRARLSVQPVEPEAWQVVMALTERGGWDEATFGKKSKKKSVKKDTSVDGDEKRDGGTKIANKKRKAANLDDGDHRPRRSARTDQK